MSNFVHVLDGIVYPMQPWLIGIAVLAWLVGFIVFLRHIRTQPLVVTGPRPMPPTAYFVALMVFGGIIGVEFLLCGIFKSAALEEVRPILDSPVTLVRVNGSLVDPPGGLISAFRQISNPIGHHSHPTRKFEVQIEADGQKVTLYALRDSGNPREYWIYYPGFRATIEIGHIFTPALDAF